MRAITSPGAGPSADNKINFVMMMLDTYFTPFTFYHSPIQASENLNGTSQEPPNLKSDGVVDHVPTNPRVPHLIPTNSINSHKPKGASFNPLKPDSG